ncbi:hypothetical protein BDV32DRAFT_5387 [Aspergillus pseudonomiae]|uniref:Uncharacterized protein n=1 Tax=Aspergillus pseudonomiae TaxID=1506151 RepID=A0A5N7DVA6_9EURO|nr:uncharacterized protein BDV37DRAFT_2867 [Aspergillus pseudonomiae]KAB8263444.1 hypothetical protein BDV32DRAFT_5387 [Aspergillus pseudonomiae]KAE8409983.1 hypothetical protein BDV37DRAFT_2867 [Aspergillus pseudonomiae]
MILCLQGLELLATGISPVCSFTPIRTENAIDCANIYETIELLVIFPDSFARIKTTPTGALTLKPYALIQLNQIVW